VETVDNLKHNTDDWQFHRFTIVENLWKNYGIFPQGSDNQ